MRTTVTADDALLAKATESTGVKDKRRSCARGCRHRSGWRAPGALAASGGTRPAAAAAPTPDAPGDPGRHFGMGLSTCAPPTRDLLELLGDDEAGCHPSSSRAGAEARSSSGMLFSICWPP